ncbi:hypothetical protein HMPREF9332_01180 [Alloprevotella rava F0323]|uniref:Uncharacterized protein n=1 Tax=Alloprevotella rava F0323 TaxID=679199 RepID=G5GC79_9BACT|nr:hypothetical protein [Alloprevotella rava]EHG22822.1 hypothetical protein HMPREF9332_01180 [Alloprevotella rava F0323]
MKEAKVVSQFSLEDIDLEGLFKQQGNFFQNEDAVILFNGDIQQSPILKKKQSIKWLSRVLFLL